MRSQWCVWVWVWVWVWEQGPDYQGNIMTVCRCETRCSHWFVCVHGCVPACVVVCLRAWLRLWWCPSEAYTSVYWEGAFSNLLMDELFRWISMVSRSYLFFPGINVCVEDVGVLPGDIVWMVDYVFREGWFQVGFRNKSLVVFDSACFGGNISPIFICLHNYTWSHRHTPSRQGLHWHVGCFL